MFHLGPRYPEQIGASLEELEMSNCNEVDNNR